MSAPVPRSLDEAIEGAIEVYPEGSLARIVEESRLDEGHDPLVVKYTAAKWSASYKAGAAIRISDSIEFTWGTGSYVTPLAFPYSSAIFGRVGIVARFDPTGWRVFDATDVENQNLYLGWFGRQPLSRRATMTMHSAFCNHVLRDRFRERYEIDCVLFKPDQRNLLYTGRDDVWMVVADWVAGALSRRIATGASATFSDSKLTVLVEEEFEDKLHGQERQALLELGTGVPDPAQATQAIATAYEQDKIVRIRA
jgi:hypothetical protein